MFLNPFIWVKQRPKELFIESFSNATRTLQIRGFTSNEQIIADHTTNSDRSLATTTVSITSIPIHLTANLSVAGVSRGECYVRVSLRVEGVVVALLGAGYVTDTGTIVFPGGKIESSIEGPGFLRSITGTDPADGVEISETVPTGARWLILLVRFSLLTSVTVASRVPRLTFTDGTNSMFQLTPPGFQSGGRTFFWNYLGNGGVGQIRQEDNQLMSLGKIFLRAGFTVETTTFNFKVDDNFSAPQLLVEEWIEP